MITLGLLKEEFVGVVAAGLIAAQPMSNTKRKAKTETFIASINVVAKVTTSDEMSDQEADAGNVFTMK